MKDTETQTRLSCGPDSSRHRYPSPGFHPAPHTFSWGTGSDTILRTEIIVAWTQPISLLVLLASAGACASPKVGYDFDPSANFSSYHTYEWTAGNREPTGDKRVDNSLVDARIRSIVEAQLRSKGYRPSAPGRPDFYVSYHAGVKDLAKGASTQRYIGDRATGKYTTINAIEPYKEGALLVDIVDGTSNQLVWQGSAVAEVDPGMTAKERDEYLTRILGAMFAHFPPQ
jgi:hypothetical protein